MPDSVSTTAPESMESESPSSQPSIIPQAIRVEREIGGRVLSIETGRIARQAHGATFVRYGETVIIAAAAAGKEMDSDFFPLTVDYREKTSAAGKFPGGFYKREGRPTTKETLTARLIDRPLRPLFPDGFRKEIAVSVNVMSADLENDPDIISLIGSSAALSLSGIPFAGPVGAVRVGRLGDRFVANPTASELEVSTLELVVAGTEEAIIMVEAGAKEIPEAVMVDALEYGHGVVKEVIALIRELAEKAGRPIVAPPETAVEPPPVAVEIRDRYYAEVYEANKTPGKLARKAAFSAIWKRIEEEYRERVKEGTVDARAISAAKADLEREVVRRQIIDENRRADLRALDEIRPITIEVGVLPRTHGSCLFTRGETQAIVTTTLGTASDTQRVDGLIEPYEKTFMLHYNFPAYSVGETWPNRGPKRREIGHGALAERALESVLPPHERFPYTMRVISDITESNGSSSMATVCGGTLALMDAAVPIRRPVAGIAMGLVKEGDQVRILSDILGNEDHEGDMDFKVAGTQLGITALQMDIKIQGITTEIMRQALEQARVGRIKILREMISVLDKPRSKISPYAPRLVTVKISADKIGALIGPGGKTIRRIQEETQTQIEIDDAAGMVMIAGGPKADMDRAVRMVRELTEEVEIGKTYRGKVISVKDFGAFVEILPGQEGLVHVSELAEDYVRNVSEVVKVGDYIEVKVIDIDNQDRIKLSKKAVDRERASRKEGVPATRA